MSVASPASDDLRGLPGWIKRRAPRASRVGILHGAFGAFAGQVARGAVEGAQAAGFTEIRLTAFESPLRDAGAIVRAAVEPEPALLVSVGAFQDDVAIARQRAARSAKTALASSGPASRRLATQWAASPRASWSRASESRRPPLVGPDSGGFIFERAFHRTPEYPAVQAFVIGVIVGECRRRRAGSLASAALLGAAHALETTTFYGGFRLDPSTGGQVGHGVRLVQVARRAEARDRLVEAATPSAIGSPGRASACRSAGMVDRSSSPIQ